MWSFKNNMFLVILFKSNLKLTLYFVTFNYCNGTRSQIWVGLGFGVFLPKNFTQHYFT